MAGPPDNFNRLLDWLDPDRKKAARRYEKIRAFLIRKFRAHDCDCAAEQLADATIDRVAGTLTTEEFENWEGDKVKKFSRVAYFILLEYKKKHREVELPEDFDVADEDEDEQEQEDEDDSEPKSICLKKCLQTLSPDKRNLIIRYYQGSKGKKIRNREVLARDLGLTLPALRVKALRIRQGLKACTLKCLADTERGRKTE